MTCINTFAFLVEASGLYHENGRRKFYSLWENWLAGGRPGLFHLFRFQLELGNCCLQIFNPQLFWTSRQGNCKVTLLCEQPGTIWKLTQCFPIQAWVWTFDSLCQLDIFFPFIETSRLQVTFFTIIPLPFCLFINNQHWRSIWLWLLRGLIGFHRHVRSVMMFRFYPKWQKQHSCFQHKGGRCKLRSSHISRTGGWICILTIQQFTLLCKFLFSRSNWDTAKM